MDLKQALAKTSRVLVGEAVAVKAATTTMTAAAIEVT